MPRVRMRSEVYGNVFVCVHVRAVRTRGAGGGQSSPGFQTVKWGGALLQSRADHSPDGFNLTTLVKCMWFVETTLYSN